MLQGSNFLYRSRGEARDRRLLVDNRKKKIVKKNMEPVQVVYRLSSEIEGESASSPC